jgi:hypothetical protein
MDWPERLLDAWIRFEREYGTIDSLRNAARSVKKLKLQVNARRAAEMAGYGSAVAGPVPMEIDTSTSMGSVESVGTVRPIPSSKKRQHEPQGLEGELKKKPRVEKQKEKAAKKVNAPKASIGDDKMDRIIIEPGKACLTVFISNLSSNATEDGLKEFFAKCGDIDAVHVKHDRRPGKEKTFAYVVFVDEKSVSEALALDRSPVQWNGKEHLRPMFVSVYAPKNVPEPEDKKTIYVSNLPRSTTYETLRTLLEKVSKYYTILFEYICNIFIYLHDQRKLKIL